MSWIATGRTYARFGLLGLAMTMLALVSVAWVYFLGLELVRGIIWSIGRS